MEPPFPGHRTTRWSQQPHSPRPALAAAVRPHEGRGFAWGEGRPTRRKPPAGPSLVAAEELREEARAGNPAACAKGTELPSLPTALPANLSRARAGRAPPLLTPSRRGAWNRPGQTPVPASPLGDTISRGAGEKAWLCACAAAERGLLESGTLLARLGARKTPPPVCPLPLLPPPPPR